MTVPWQHPLLLSRARPAMRQNMRYSVLPSRGFWLFRLSSVRWGILIYLLSWQYKIFDWLSLKCKVLEYLDHIADSSKGRFLPPLAINNGTKVIFEGLWSRHTHPKDFPRSSPLMSICLRFLLLPFFDISFPICLTFWFSGMSGRHSSPTWSAPAIALTTISGSEWKWRIYLRPFRTPYDYSPLVFSLDLLDFVGSG